MIHSSSLEHNGRNLERSGPPASDFLQQQPTDAWVHVSGAVGMAVVLLDWLMHLRLALWTKHGWHASTVWSAEF